MTDDKSVPPCHTTRRTQKKKKEEKKERNKKTKKSCSGFDAKGLFLNKRRRILAITLLL